MDRVCGIYCIENIKTGQYYIGSSVNIMERFWHHKSDLKNNRHSNSHLQNSYNKYGVDSFLYSILELCEPNILRKLEGDYLKIFYCNKHKLSFNICMNTDGPMSMKHTDATKLKISVNHARYWKNKQKPLELCIRMSIQRKNKPLPYKYKPLLQFDLSGNLIEEFESLKFAMLKYGTGVWAAANGKVKTSAGYIWKYKQDLNVN